MFSWTEACETHHDRNCGVAHEATGYLHWVARVSKRLAALWASGHRHDTKPYILTVTLNLTN